MYIFGFARQFLARRHFMALSFTVAIGVAALLVSSYIFRAYEESVRLLMLGKAPHVTLSGNFLPGQAEKIVAALSDREETAVALPIIRLEGEISVFVDKPPENWLDMAKPRERQFMLQGTLPVLVIGIPVAATGTLAKHPDLERLLPEDISLSRLERDEPIGMMVSAKILAKAGIPKPQSWGDRIYASLSLTDEQGISRTSSVADFATVGVFREELVAEPRSHVILASHNLQKLLEKQAGVNVNAVDLRLKDPYLAESVGKRLRVEFPQLNISNWMEQNAGVLAFLSMLQVVIHAIVGMMILVAGFGIATVLFLTVLEKRPQIAVLKSLGIPPAKIAQIFVSIALWVGILGCLAGAVVGSAAILWLESNRTRWLGNLSVRGEGFPLHIGDVGIIFVASCLVCMVFSLAPAISAARQDPVAALKI